MLGQSVHGAQQRGRNDAGAPVLDHIRTQLGELDSRIADLARARSAMGDILDASTRVLAHV
ncbi:hypothetical protein ACQP1V_11755 [Microtetraspora malaysiensis]|uniref:hypothetical protein n=1 Tax=Microtetraspora malaysiensis TaxID=161358 RepID=UPI003D9171A7